MPRPLVISDKEYLAANSVDGETTFPSPVVPIDPESKKVTKLPGDLGQYRGHSLRSSQWEPVLSSLS